MSGNTTEVPPDLPSDEILGLPVATFAYILVGVGIAAGLLFFVCFTVIYKYRKLRRLRGNPLEKRHNKFTNVRDAWEKDTLQRMENLKKAGYNNEAFQNFDDYRLYTVDEYTKIENFSDKYKKLAEDTAKTNVHNTQFLIGDAALANGHAPQKNGSVKRVTFNTVPVVQINGAQVDDIDHAISNHSDMVCHNPVKRADDFFVGNNFGGKKHANVLVSANSKQLIAVTDDTVDNTKTSS